MLQLIKQLEKEIATASKAFEKADNIKSGLRSKPNKTEADYIKFNEAVANWNKYDVILTALYPMLKKIQSITENN